ncbi:hypothetical protein ACQP1P_38115 [Dactylosporangium sp. CA-052675]|uniref:hypothetical protein n=1 Tax=Dactylosporangium sp. CA-052675 TaxID=3239927 RepID=UPI003D8A0F7B
MAEEGAAPFKVEHLRGATNTVGRELFTYCLNLENSEIGEIEDSLSALPDHIGSALAEMVDTLTAFKVRSAISDVPLELLIDGLSVIDSGGKRSSIFNAWRIRCGGLIPDFRTGDPLMDVLAPYLSDIYPTTILFRHLTGQPWRFQVMPSFGSDVDLMRDFGDAVLADPALSRLFPNRAEDSLQVSAHFLSNTGRAGTLQLPILPSAIFGAAYAMFRLRQQSSAPDLRDSVATTIDLLRSLAGGRTVSVPAWIGVGNIAIPEDLLELPWGNLLKYPEPTQLEIIPSGARPAVGTDTEGANVTLGAILETRFAAQIVVTDQPPSSEVATVWPATMAREFAKLDGHFANTSLAATLATERNPPAGCRRLWTAIFDPTSFGHHLSFRTDATPPVAPHIFSPSEADSLQQWSQILNSTSVAKFSISQRRILSAVAERVDPVDGFIDVIVAWESLFAGTDQGELSFRISSAMASLLYERGPDRIAEQKRLVALYNKRSKVLHGAQEITPEDALESRDYAVRAILECIRRLFHDYPEMLQDPNRSKAIILNL